MRRFLIVCWLLAPVAAGAYHFGPGQDRMILDDAAAEIERAQELAATAQAVTEADGDDAAREAWAEAAEAYEDALQALPDDRVSESRRMRLELAKAKMHISKLPQANSDLQSLVQELREDADADEKLATDAQDALANSQYYMTWLLRLEGKGRERWEPEIESARQLYKQLAAQAQAAGDTDGYERLQKDLESSIRLARMNLDELQGLPLPGQ